MNRNPLTVAILIALGHRAGVIFPGYRTLIISADGIGELREYPYYGYKAG